MTIRPPAGEEEWDEYFRFRWRWLREPWGQPPGSERDEHEKQAHHLLAEQDGEIIGFMDGDGQHDAAEFERLLAKLDSGYDMVIGARDSGSHANVGLLRAQESCQCRTLIRPRGQALRRGFPEKFCHGSCLLFVFQSRSIDKPRHCHHDLTHILSSYIKIYSFSLRLSRAAR